MTKGQQLRIGKAIDAARMIGLSLNTPEETEKVRETLRLYNGSWIIGALQAVLAHDGVSWQYDWTTEDPGKLVTLDRRRPL